MRGDKLGHYLDDKRPVHNQEVFEMQRAKAGSVKTVSKDQSPEGGGKEDQATVEPEAQVIIKDEPVDLKSEGFEFSLDRDHAIQSGSVAEIERLALSYQSKVKEDTNILTNQTLREQSELEQEDNSLFFVAKKRSFDEEAEVP